MLFRERVLLFCCLLAACEPAETRDDVEASGLDPDVAGASGSDGRIGPAGTGGDSDGTRGAADTPGGPDSCPGDAGTAGRGPGGDSVVSVDREQGGDSSGTAGTAGTKAGASAAGEPSGGSGVSSDSTRETLAAPHGLDVGAVSGKRVLTWADCADDEQGFEIEHRAGRSGDFEHLANAPANATAFELPELEPGEHYFRMRAVGRSGASEFSETYGLLISGAIDPARVPVVPSVSIFVSSPDITFSWAAADFLEDEGGCPTDDECGYRVYSRGNLETNYDIVSVAKDAVSVTVPYTLIETSYYISVFNQFGDSGLSYIATVR